MRPAISALVMLGMAVLLTTASVIGSGGASSRRQGQIPPVPSLTTSKPLTRLRSDTRATVELPSQVYGVEADAYAPVVDLGSVDPRALTNLQDNQVGVDRAINEDVDAESIEISNPEGTRLRALAIKSTDAKALRLHFTGVDLPEGDQVFVYGLSADSHVAGPYSGKGPFGDGDFWSDAIEGDTAIIEHLVQPGHSSKLMVSAVAHIFVGLDTSDFAPQILPCEVDAQCGAFAQKNAVARILFQDGGSFVCSGSLVNNRAQDQTPFFMTAAHCVNNDTVAHTVQAFWFYQTTACDSGVLRPDVQQTSGATMLITQNSSDETLLRMLTAPPPGVVFVGWDPNPKLSGTSVYGLHHPGGSVPPSTGSFLRSAQGTIGGSADCPVVGLISGYLVNWSSGNTEAGSSGSGLFDSSSGALIGILSCGPPSPSCDSPLSLYSKFSDFYPLASTFIDTGTPSCVTSLSPGSRDFTASGGQGTVDVFAPVGCNWTASTAASWITITANGPGAGNGTVTYQVAVNASVSPRSGTVTVQNQTHTINQAGMQCSVSLSPASRSFAPAGGDGSVSVTTTQDCSWSAAVSDAWITLTSGEQGTGNGTINYSVATNTAGASRMGQITVQGQIHTISQNGANCTFSLSPLGATVSPTGGSGNMNVTVPAGCTWTAESNASWLTITSGSSGSGNGTVSYSASMNAGTSARTAQITVADKTFSVAQNAGPLIQSAEKSGKKVIVDGVNFGMGADLLMDGVAQKKVRNDEASPSTRLIAKKLIKKISKGQTVMFQVRNPDGALSPAFSYTRPASTVVVNVPPLPRRPRMTQRVPGVRVKVRRPHLE